MTEYRGYKSHLVDIGGGVWIDIKRIASVEEDYTGTVIRLAGVSGVIYRSKLTMDKLMELCELEKW